MKVSDYLRRLSVRRRSRKVLKAMEAVERETRHVMKALDKMHDPSPWRELHADLGMIHSCAGKGVKLLKGHVGPRNIMEAIEILRKIAEMEKTERTSW